MSKSRKTRRLNDDDLALWRKVTERTEKLDLKSLFTPAIDAPVPSPLPLMMESWTVKSLLML